MLFLKVSHRSGLSVMSYFNRTMKGNEVMSHITCMQRNEDWCLMDVINSCCDTYNLDYFCKCYGLKDEGSRLSSYLSESEHVERIIGCEVLSFEDVSMLSRDMPNTVEHLCRMIKGSSLTFGWIQFIFPVCFKYNKMNYDCQTIIKRPWP